MQDPESVVEESNPRVAVGVGETAVQGSENYEVGAHDGFSIPLEAPGEGRADLWGGELVAKLKLGGAKAPEGDFPAQEVDILHVHWVQDADYQEVKRHAMHNKRDQSDLMMLALDSDGRPAAAAFLRPRSIYTLGREGNVGWFRLGRDTLTPDGWSPFEENLSVSRKQVTLFYGTGELGIYGQSENSKTELTAKKAKQFQVVQQK